MTKGLTMQHEWKMNIRGRMLSITIASKVDQMGGGMVVLNSKQWWSLVAYLLHGHLN